MTATIENIVGLKIAIEQAKRDYVYQLRSGADGEYSNQLRQQAKRGDL